MTYKKKVLFVSTSYPTDSKDWKGVFISQLVFALSKEHEYAMKLWMPPGEFPKDAQYICNDVEREWLRVLMENGGIAHLVRKNMIKGGLTAIRLLGYLANVYKREENDVELIHVNWLQNALSIGRGYKPLLVTVLGTDMKFLTIPGMRLLLRRVFKRRPCIIAPNAEWMVQELEIMFGDLCEIRHINFGIEAYWYQLKRSMLGDNKKWLVVLRLTKNKIGKLFEWGEEIFNGDGHELHLFGPMQEKLDLPEWVHYHGSTNPHELYSHWFPQASGLITLSEHDEGRPQIILEAMAAGLPVVASAIPAHSNIIEHKKTGWLCHDKEEFYCAINELAHWKENKKIGEQAKAWMELQVGTWEDCAKRYTNAYKELLGD